MADLDPTARPRTGRARPGACSFEKPLGDLFALFPDLPRARRRAVTREVVDASLDAAVNGQPYARETYTGGFRVSDFKPGCTTLVVAESTHGLILQVAP